MHHSAAPARENTPSRIGDRRDVAQVAARSPVFACGMRCRRIWSASKHPVECKAKEGSNAPVMHIPANMCTYKAWDPRRGRRRDHGTGWDHSMRASCGGEGRRGGITQGIGWGDGEQPVDLLGRAGEERRDQGTVRWGDGAQHADLLLRRAGEEEGSGQ